MAYINIESFTEDQRRAYQALVDGKNVFLTGEAGTGKSYVLEAFISHCEREHKQILAMAPTGIAALNLTKGTTIHRTLGIPANFCDPNAAIGLPHKVLQRAEVIIIDEISMCRIDLFERVIRMIVAAQAATGTKQVVLVGDFFQLSPVVTQRDLEAVKAEAQAILKGSASSRTSGRDSISCRTCSRRSTGPWSRSMSRRSTLHETATRLVSHSLTGGQSATGRRCLQTRYGSARAMRMRTT
ncbi:MAG: AAA family ATPase [Atopobiaceae bacterium]|nr:AAA family ATPase [Atopobiaceae bacterium]